MLKNAVTSSMPNIVGLHDVLDSAYELAVKACMNGIFT